MRILHTSDFHLGLQSGQFSRSEEHQLFFTWLTKTLEEHQVDSLIVAGDIFDSINPSNEALRQYYQFLRDVQTSGVRDVIIVGGNHDSASQLEAPRAVLSALNVHVVGGFSREADPQSFLAPLRVRGKDEPVAVCITLPYVHEWRLGIRTTDDQATTQKEFRERFSALYRDLADLAEKLYPGLPLVGTGHLTMGKTEKGDFPREIHQVGFIDSLPPEVMDSRLKYVALGHIHRSFPVERGRIWYSGTPLPTSLPEMKHPRVVLLVDLPNTTGEAPDHHTLNTETEIKIVRLEVPVARELLEVTGNEIEVTHIIKTLTWASALAPFLYLRLQLTAPDPQLHSRLREALQDAHPPNRQPIIVELREELARSPAESGEQSPTALEDLTARQVFEKLCDQRGVTPDDELLQAFQLVESIDKETLVKKIEAIVAGTESHTSTEAAQGNIPSDEVSS